ncbi:hypothetical protein Cni_G04912 [Canna indica]|uniref:Uncharacterized protein n=1 Tax=Canna indica TaxID=4628 RepID=A0AAQ3Q4F4_9LILI|nr:hypothetical protein Cni_G04912 [Canna indica]
MLRKNYVFTAESIFCATICSLCGKWDGVWAALLYWIGVPVLVLLPLQVKREIYTTWTRDLFLIAWSIAAASLVLYARSIASSRTEDSIWALVSAIHFNANMERQRCGVMLSPVMGAPAMGGMTR